MPRCYRKPVKNGLNLVKVSRFECVLTHFLYQPMISIIG